MLTTLSRIALLGTLAIALGTVHLAQAVLADGKPLPAGTYQMQLSGESPTPAVGQSAGRRGVGGVRAGQEGGRPRDRQCDFCRRGRCARHRHRTTAEPLARRYPQGRRVCPGLDQPRRPELPHQSGEAVGPLHSGAMILLACSAQRDRHALLRIAGSQR